MKTLFLLSVLVSTILFLSACKEKEVPKQSINIQSVNTEDKEKKAEEPKVEVKPTVKETPRYFLIAGCFEYIGNANKLCAKLQKEGYPDAQVLSYYENLYLVAYEGYAKKDDARAALKFMKESPDKKDTWLHHKK